MKRIMTLTMMAFLFCLLSQLGVIRPAAAEDVWFYSFSDADVYFSTDSIQKGREYSNTIYTVRTATVKHSTGELWRANDFYAFADENDRIYYYSLNKVTGRWEGGTAIAKDAFGKALWETSKPYAKQKGIYIGNWN